jgi:hypothetical protein
LSWRFIFGGSISSAVARVFSFDAKQKKKEFSRDVTPRCAGVPEMKIGRMQSCLSDELFTRCRRLKGKEVLVGSTVSRMGMETVCPSRFILEAVAGPGRTRPVGW